VPVADLVRLDVVPNQGEADVICSLLRVNGIVCGDRVMDASAGTFGGAGGTGGWREVLVSEPDLARARELLATRTD
jgi:hypothetical protein